jgi:hypothetical protein
MENSKSQKKFSFQNLISNPSFEYGLKEPDGWKLNGGIGKWEDFGKTGKKCISLTGSGTETNAWEYTEWKPEPGKLYFIKYSVCCWPENVGGVPITGFSTVNRDARYIPNDGNWYDGEFICRTPIHRDSILRFGQREVKGTVAFDDIEVLSVFSIHKQFDKFQLGFGEVINNGIYRFFTNLGGFSSNDNRVLFAHTASFNSNGFNLNRWVLDSPISENSDETGAWVIYRHNLTIKDNSIESHIIFKRAKLNFNVEYYESGDLVIDVSSDGKKWKEIGRFSSGGIHTVEIPNDILPLKEIWVRIWSTGVLHVTSYWMEAEVSDKLPDAIGETWYFVIKKVKESEVSVEPKAVKNDVLLVLLKNNSTENKQLNISLGINKKRNSVKVLLKPNSEQIISLIIPHSVKSKENFTLVVKDGRRVVYETEVKVRKLWIEVGGFGYNIKKRDKIVLWWCESTYKVGKTTPFPSENNTSIVYIESACNEYEPFQIIFTPKVGIKKLYLRLEPFKPLAKHFSCGLFPIWDEVALVEYVPITVPTDSWSGINEYPDVLTPLFRRDRYAKPEKSQAIEIQVENLKPNRNQPLWITVYVPKGVKKGRYHTNITIIEAIDENGNLISDLKCTIPVEIYVFDFTLPDDTPLRTAYGVYIENDWHRLKTHQEFSQVWDLYMQVCHRYRISPYTPYAYAPIEWKIVGPKTEVDNGILRFIIDRWHGYTANIERYRSNSLKEKQTPSGKILFLIEQFEESTQESKKDELVGGEIISDIKIIEKDEKRLVLEITVERVNSQPFKRKFSATLKLIIEEGKPYFRVNLVRIVNTDTVRWSIRRYFHLLLPNFNPSSVINTDDFGVWYWQSEISDLKIVFGATGNGFTYDFDIGSTYKLETADTREYRGNVSRLIDKWIEPGEVLEIAKEPEIFVFINDIEQKLQKEQKEKEILKEFINQMLKSEIPSESENKIKVIEKTEPEFYYNFTEFDSVMNRYIEEFHFNGFNLVILPETLAGYKRFTPEWRAIYKQLMAPIIQHLEQKGWLKFAYCYWIDEPPREDYEYVKQGMLSLKEACPGVRRLLTFCHDKAPVPIFYDFVDLWVPVMQLFDEGHAKERQALGEEVWWYVCTTPKAPYPNNFIDHPAITHRIRYWMAAKWNLDGDLYWSMTFWRGKNYSVYNPYENGQTERPGGGYWGSGDGRLLYPPVKKPLSEDSEPVILPPVPSLRLALISEGIEDYCYFWLLKKLQQDGYKRLKQNKLLSDIKKALEKSNKALQCFEKLIRRQIDYELDPKKLYAERHRVAKAIERLIEVLGEK